MASFKHQKANERPKPSSRLGDSFHLFYWEQVGNRHYLRLTLFALLLAVGLIVISIIVMVIIFLSGNLSSNSNNINIKVTTPPESTDPHPSLKRAPSLSVPKTSNQSKAGGPQSSTPKLDESLNNASSNRAMQTNSTKNINEK